LGDDLYELVALAAPFHRGTPAFRVLNFELYAKPSRLNVTLGFLGTSFVIGFLGRMAYEKRQKETAAAAAAAAAAAPPSSSH
jgi:hypothetical protein